MYRERMLHGEGTMVTALRKAAKAPFLKMRGTLDRQNQNLRFLNMFKKYSSLRRSFLESSFITKCKEGGIRNHIGKP